MTEPGRTAESAGWIRSVTIIGLGVMGGSVAKAVARRLPAVPVVGVEPDAGSARAAARDGVRLVGDPGECRPDGSVVVFAAPLDATVALVRDGAAVWREAALATDVASLKVPVLAVGGRRLRRVAPDVRIGAVGLRGGPRGSLRGCRRVALPREGDGTWDR